MTLLFLTYPYLIRPFNTNYLKNIFKEIENFFINFFKEFTYAKLIKLAVFFLSINFLRIYFDYLRYNLFSIFTKNDPIFSWNKWAIEWASNLLPINTWHYPQLIPANWSITYVFINNVNIQFFAKAIMPVFVFFILLAIFDLGLKSKKIFYFISVIIIALLVSKYQGTYFIMSGFIDIPVSFMCLISIYTLLIAAREKKIDNKIKYIFLSSIFAAGTALMKQAGIFIVCLQPLLAYLLVIKDLNELTAKDKVILIFKIIGIALLLTLPWYIYKEIQINLSLDSSEINGVTEITHNGKSYLQRLVDSLINYKLINLFIIVCISF